MTHHSATRAPGHRVISAGGTEGARALLATRGPEVRALSESAEIAPQPLLGIVDGRRYDRRRENGSGGKTMKVAKLLALCAAIPFLPGCLLLVGAGVGAAAVGVIVASGDDSAEVILDKSPPLVVEAARETLIRRGVLVGEEAGRLEARVENSKVVVRILVIREGETKVVVSARKTLDVVPDQGLAGEIARDIANAVMRPDYPTI
jgi:hypothetical protein